MSEVSTAVIIGVLIFVGGQICQRFFLEPLLEQRKLIGEIAFQLVFFANVDSSLATSDEKEDAKKILRSSAAKLRATPWTIPAYSLLALVGIVPRRKAIMEASKNLIGWSNSVYGSSADYGERRRVIANALHIGVES